MMWRLDQCFRVYELALDIYKDLVKTAPVPVVFQLKAG